MPSTFTIPVRITPHIVAFRLFLLFTRVLMIMREAATITGHTHNVFNPHATCKERNCQKETDDKDGNHHQNPRYGFEPTEAESLEDPRSENTD